MDGVYLKYNNNISYYDNFITMHRFLKQNNISYSSCIIYPTTKDNLMDKKNPIKIYPVPIINRTHSPYYDRENYDIDDNDNYHIDDNYDIDNNYDIDDNNDINDNNNYANNDYDIDDNYY